LLGTIAWGNKTPLQEQDERLKAGYPDSQEADEQAGDSLRKEKLAALDRNLEAANHGLADEKSC
jgi:hypothetical protein